MHPLELARRPVEAEAGNCKPPHWTRGSGQCSEVMNSVMYYSVSKGLVRKTPLERVWAAHGEMVEK